MNWTEVVTHSLSANWYSYCYYYYTSRRKTRKNKHKQKNKNSSKKISRNVYLLPVNVISFTFLSPAMFSRYLSSSILTKTRKDEIEVFLFSLEIKVFIGFIQCLWGRKREIRIVLAWDIKYRYTPYWIVITT